MKVYYLQKTRSIIVNFFVLKKYFGAVDGSRKSLEEKYIKKFKIIQLSSVCFCGISQF